MTTDITILDTLLGPKQSLAPKTQAMLIRGAPGSGKTTLALEILARQIAKDDFPALGFFLSLEVNPRDAWESVYRRLNPELAVKLPNPKNSLKEDKKNPKVLVLQNTKASLRLAGRDWLDNAVPFGDWRVVKECLKREIKRQLAALREERERQKDVGEKKGLIVLDSINLLGDIVQNKLFSPNRAGDMRAVMHGIWTILEETRGRNNLILIGEHHPGAPYDISLLSESFACDVELLLAAEPIAGTPTIPTNLLGTLGYSFERRQHSKPLSDEPQSVEIRSFCRVLKSRFTPNQSRRCAYDIVAGQGVVFTESYPGDGALLLFHENTKQKEWWETFLSLDVPLQFPALRYSLFDRKALQHVFSTQRRFNKLHQKTDMFLACFDTYWVDWYWQLGRRSHLRSIMEAAFPRESKVTNEEGRKAWSRFLCGVDRLTRIAMTCPKPEPWIPDKDIQSRNRFVDQWILGREQPYVRKSKIHQSICKAVEDLADGSAGLLGFIPKSELRLFGERRSEIISELERHDETQGHLPRATLENHYLSVPYNANASFLVCRKDALDQVRIHQKADPDTWNASLKGLLGAQAEALALFQNTSKKWLKNRRGREEWRYDHQATDFHASLHPRPLSAEEKSKEEEDLKRRENTLKQVMLVRTWEDLILLCMDGKYESDIPRTHTKAKSVKATKQFVIEAQTFDSLLCVLLEIFWGFGGELRINPQYEIDNVTETEQKLFQAFFLLREMFRLNVIEPYSTLDPKRFGERFPHSGKTKKFKTSSKIKSTDLSTDWLFARHWYSTFIDVLTHKHEPSKANFSTANIVHSNVSDMEEFRGRYTWQPGSGIEMCIQPLPYSEAAYPPGGKEKGRPVSCWGEWHLAILNGSENKTLGVELINNLMGSNAICERAARCVAVPTVEEFYKRYGDVPCVRLPEREDVAGMPKLTYQELRDCVFDVARLRRPIFDYRHCMREIHSVITIVQHDPHVSVEQLAEHVLQAVDRIHLLQTQEVMSH